MGFTELLTIIFVLLKCFDVVTWSWWIVFLPEIIAVAFWLLIFILGLCGVGSTCRNVKKSFKDFDF